MKRREFLKTGLEGIVLAGAILKFAKADSNNRLKWKFKTGEMIYTSSPINR